MFSRPADVTASVRKIFKRNIIKYINEMEEKVVYPRDYLKVNIDVKWISWIFVKLELQRWQNKCFFPKGYRLILPLWDWSNLRPIFVHVRRKFSLDQVRLLIKENKHFGARLLKKGDRKCWKQHDILCTNCTIYFESKYPSFSTLCKIEQ